MIAVGWWDHWNPNQINQWWAGEQVYPFYWQRLVLTLAVVLPITLLAWWSASRLAAGRDTSPKRHRRWAAWGFAAAFAIPLILLLKYRVTWLGMNYGSSVWTYGLILVLSAVIVWLTWPILRNRGMQEWLDQQGPVIILIAMVAYVVVYGGLSIAGHASFRTHALDLGTTDQAMWNTSRGRILEYTPLPVTFDDAIPDLSPKSRLADGKLELAFLPLSLLYWLWADPRLLIALQAILLTSGAVPLYYLARTRLDDSVASLTITLAYLLYLPLHYVTLDGFHASALMVPFLLWAWHAAEQGRWRNYYLAVGIALLCRVDAALVLLGMGAYFSLRGTWQSRRHGVATLLLGLAWIALDFGLVSPWARGIYGPGTNELSSERYGELGVAWALLSHPQDALRALLGREKLQTLVDLIATLGGIPLLAPLLLLPALPVLILNLLIAPSHQNAVLARYFAPVIPFLFIAAVRGVDNLGRWITRFSMKRRYVWLSVGQVRRLVALFALTTTLLAGVFFSPLPPGWRFRLAHYYQIGEHERALARTLDLIPADAVVSAQSHLFPHLSRRPVIYLFPTIADAEYVVIDLDYSTSKTPIDQFTFYSTVDSLLADSNFHVAAFDNGALLLQRGPGQSPPALVEALAEYKAGLYRSAIVEYRGPTRLRADNLYQATVVLENRGTQSWKTAGLHPIYLSYRWWTADGDLVALEGLRTSLGQTIKPGDTLAQRARFVTPARPGDYALEWDLVHEGRTWFGEQGGITLRVDVTVE